MDLIVVDGSNLYSAAGRMLEALKVAPDVAKPYLAEWFDVDRLVRASLPHKPTGARLGIVIFHSVRAIGGNDTRLTGPDADRFWARQGSSPNTSCISVVIPGDQQETYPFTCDGCGRKHQKTTSTEKGLDTSITTYLLETADRWESACIVARDVDYVPPVLALRRKGKSVFVASERLDRATALTRVCQSFYELDADFLRLDVAAFQLARTGGVFDELSQAYDKPDQSRFRIGFTSLGDLHAVIQLGVGTDSITRVEFEREMLAKVHALGLVTRKTEDHLPRGVRMHTVLVYSCDVHQLTNEGIFRRTGQVDWLSVAGSLRALHEPVAQPEVDDSDEDEQPSSVDPKSDAPTEG